MDAIVDLSPSSPPSRHDAMQHDMSRHTLTIKQASAMFTNLGVPRSTRSVQRFCEIGSIDCIRVKGEKTERYFINQPSVERYAKELEQLEHISRIEDDKPRHDVTQHDMARHDAPRRDESQRVAVSEMSEPVPVPVSENSSGSQELKSRIDVLEKENLQLKIDRSAKEQVIGHIMDERQKMIDRLTELGRDIGRLESQLLQLAAPQHDMPRHDATDRDTEVFVPAPVAQVDTVGVVAPEPIVPTEAVAPQPPFSQTDQRSVWARIFLG